MNILINFLLAIPKLGIIALITLGLIYFAVHLIEKTFNPGWTVAPKEVIPPMASFIAALTLVYAFFSPILGPKTSQNALEDVVIEETYEPSQKVGSAPETALRSDGGPLEASKPVLQLDYKLRYKEIQGN